MAGSDDEDMPLPRATLNARVKQSKAPAHQARAEGPSDLPTLEELNKLREELGMSKNKDGNNYVESESFKERSIRKFNSNPFVPIGCVATSLMLIGAMTGFHKNDKKKTQIFLRGRVAAQGLTLIALTVGVLFFGEKQTLPDVENFNED